MYPGSGRDLMCLSPKIPLFVSLRRANPVQITKSNGDKYVAIMTSEGTKELPINEFYRFVAKMNPDVILSLADIPTIEKTSDQPADVIPRPGGNRIKKMTLRTERWMENLIEYLSSSSSSSKTPDLFAPVLPYVDLRTQTPYLEYLENLNKNGKLSGLSIWSKYGHTLVREKDANPDQSLWKNTIDFLKEKKLDTLIRYNNSLMETPHDILDQILESGSDLFNGDLVDTFTDAGVVLDFVFPAPQDSSPESASPKPIGMNMWEDQYTEDMSTLGTDTPNVTGTHNKAYIHHLLNAHEMTAWVLLKIHNLNVLDLFFKGIQESLNKGTFEEDAETFKSVYGTRENALTVLTPPLKTTEESKNLNKKRLPKARGYTVGYSELQSRTRGSEEGQKLNEKRWRADM